MNFNKILSFSALFFLYATSFAFAAKTQEDKESERKSETDSRQDQQVSKDPYILMGPINITIIKEGEPKGYIRISISLEAPDTKTWQEIQEIAPRLQNAYAIELSSILSEFWIVGSQPELTNVRNILQLITNKTLGNDRVKAVLMQSYFYAKADPAQNRDF